MPPDMHPRLVPIGGGGGNEGPPIRCLVRSLGLIETDPIMLCAKDGLSDM